MFAGRIMVCALAQVALESNQVLAKNQNLAVHDLAAVSVVLLEKRLKQPVQNDANRCSAQRD